MIRCWFFFITPLLSLCPLSAHLFKYTALIVQIYSFFDSLSLVYFFNGYWARCFFFLYRTIWRIHCIVWYLVCHFHSWLTFQTLTKTFRITFPIRYWTVVIGNNEIKTNETENGITTRKIYNCTHICLAHVSQRERSFVCGLTAHTHFRGPHYY